MEWIETGSGDEMYLVCLATHRAGLPLVSADGDNLLAQLVVRVLGQAVIGAGQLFAKEALLAAVAAHGASSGFVFGCDGLGGGAVGAQRCQQQAAGPK